MGEILQAACSCDYKSEELFVGVGMNFPETKAVYALALCDHCETIITVNKNKKQIQCPECHNEVSLFQEQVVVSNFPDYKQSKIIRGNKTRPEGIYYCPECKQKNMRFVEIGMWD